MVIEKSIFKFLKEVENKIVGVLCSGGVDSMALLNLITSNSKNFNIKVIVLHVYENNNFEKKVFSIISSYCVKNNLKLILQEINNNNNNNILINLRQTKFDLASIDGIDCVVSGHHYDDQIETFLFRLFRGSGLTGLKSMSYKTVFNINNKEITYYRPLLDITKEQIIEYSKQNNIKYFNDPFNEDPNISDRNYIRLKVIPLIKSRFNNFNNNIKFIIDNIATLNEDIKNKIPKHTNSSFDLEEFNTASLEIKTYAIREYLRIKHGYNMSKRITNYLKSIINKPLTTGFCCQLKENIYICVTSDKLNIVYLK